jgi:antitoxin component of RelBE/YafQ-DinJ toxin-antitoxin module
MSNHICDEKTLPIAARFPNPTTVKAMQSTDKKQGKRFRSAKKLFEELGPSSCADSQLPAERR